MFLKEKQLPIVPEGGHERHDRQSVIAIKYLEWYAVKYTNFAVKHACNGGEHVVNLDGKKYRLDGYIKEENLAIEVLGCHYHGCIHHTTPNEISSNGKVCAYLYF